MKRHYQGAIALWLVGILLLWHPFIPFPQYVTAGFNKGPGGGSATPTLVNFSGMPAIDTSTTNATAAIGTQTYTGANACPTDTYCAPVTDPSLTGNTVVVIYAYHAASGNTANVPSITSYTGNPNSGYSSTGDTYTHCGTEGNQSTNDYYIGCYYKIGATTGTTMVHVTWTAAVTHPRAAIYQFYNITAVDGYNSNSGSAATAWTTGSVTSTANNDMYVSCAIGTSTINSVAAFSPGSGFTLDLDDKRDAGVCEEQVQSSAGALNPGITAGTSNNYAGFTLALTSGSAGTLPSGASIAHIYRASSPASVTANYAYSFAATPGTGHLLVVATTSGEGQQITAASDTTNGSWTTCGTGVTFNASVGSGNPSGSSIFYKANATGGNLAVTLTNNGTSGDTGPAVFYDILGAATSQPCTSSAYINNASTATATTYSMMSNYASGSSSGITLGIMGEQNNTSLGTLVGTQDCSTTGGQSDNGPSYPDQNNGCTHFYFSSNTPNNLVWSLVTNGEDVGVTSGAFVSFEAPGATVYPHAVGQTTAHSSSSGTTVATASYTPFAAGDTLVVLADTAVSTGTISIADGGTNTYTAIDGPTNAGGYRIATFYAKNISASAITITATFGTTNSQRSIFVIEYNGTSTTSPLDQHSISAETAGTGGAFSISTPSTTSTANEAAFAFCTAVSYCDGNPIAGYVMPPPFSQWGVDTFGNADAYLTLGATGTITANFVDSNGSGSADAAAIVTVK